MLLSGNDSGAINTLLKSETGSKLLAEAKKFGSKLNSSDDIDDKEETTEALIHELLLVTSSENCQSTEENKNSFLNKDQKNSITFTPHDTGYWNNQTKKNSKKSKASQPPDKDHNIMATINALDLAIPKRTPANITKKNNPMQMVTQFIHKVALKRPEINIDPQPITVFPFASEGLNYTA